MSTKTIMIMALAVVLLAFGWYTISPLFINRELQEESPLEYVSSEHDQDEPVMVDTQTSNPVKHSNVVSTVPSSTKSVPVKPIQQTPSQLVAEANFVASAHDVQGKAVLINTGNKNIVRFEDFNSINGPDLRIYLSKDLKSTDYIDLGPIKANKGNVNYDVPAGVDVSKYNKVLVWCRAFSVLFSYAELK